MVLFQNLFAFAHTLFCFAQPIAQFFCQCLLVFNVKNGCAVGDHQMWQDVRLAVDHEHASEFVSPILDAPVLRHPNLPIVPATTKHSKRQAQWKGATMQGWLLCFPRPKSCHNHGPQISSERTSFGRQFASRNWEGMFLSHVQNFLRSLCLKRCICICVPQEKSTGLCTMLCS